MQVYSRSQGKIIEAPDNQGITQAPASAVAAHVNNTAQDPNADYQAKSTKMKSLFTAMMLQNPKQAGLLKSVYDLNAPEKPKEPTDAEKKATDAKNQKVQGLKQQLASLDKLQGEIDTTGTGAQNTDLFGIRSKLPSNFGGFDEKTAALGSDLSQANTNLFKLAGTQFTEGEKKLLPGLVLDLTKNKELNSSALKKWREILGSQLEGETGQTNKTTTKKKSTADPLGLF